MKYVFGSTLIAKDVNSAKLCTFDKNVRLRSVTLEGDIYEPSGQLTGGAKSSNSGFLSKMQRLKHLNQKLKKARLELEDLENQIIEVQTKNSYYNEMNQKLELKKHEIQLLESRISNNPHYKLIQQVDKMKEEMTGYKDSMTQLIEKQRNAHERVLFIEKEMNELTYNRADKLKSLKVESF